MLDSWVRFEQQEKENEQAELARAVIDKVMKGLTQEKTQRDVLLNAVAEVERKCQFEWFIAFLLNIANIELVKSKAI